MSSYKFALILLLNDAHLKQKKWQTTKKKVQSPKFIKKIKIISKKKITSKKNGMGH